MNRKSGLAVVLIVGLALTIFGFSPFGSALTNSLVPASFHVQDQNGTPVVGAALFLNYQGGTGVHPAGTFYSDANGDFSVYKEGDWSAWAGWKITANGYVTRSGSGAPPNPIVIQSVSTPTPTPTVAPTSAPTTQPTSEPTAIPIPTDSPADPSATPYPIPTDGSEPIVEDEPVFFNLFNVLGLSLVGVAGLGFVSLPKGKRK